MPIKPPTIARPPKWAQTLVSAANARTRARQAADVFTLPDLIAAWTRCGGRCAFSGLAFGMDIVGDGQARRPFAPSLDRIDRHQPYRRDNVRLVVAVANFAMNAWGDAPVIQLAAALHARLGDLPLPARDPAPADAEIDGTAAVEADLVEAAEGLLVFPPQSDMRSALLALLAKGPQWSRALEDALADRFSITPRMRAEKQRSGCPIWRNHVAWTLATLRRHDLGTGQVELAETGKSPDGGRMGLYRLTQAAAAA